ncbi:class I SAM-dependent DNA methyltransferase [Candidatus Epulonipiscium viviparus]|uniref:class I SAM-dependent DNA methyltransferase n=1 Tax=Candidatus Epulonipiscium viviparus TaxID=420336 RepID=UPI0027380AA1|nr:class I SAM-dependent methyltransferase [Candidatus Epulopiscium viviparus]
MEAYQNFAAVYDEFMEDVQYDRWYKFIVDVMAENNVTAEIVCDLGCGTGTMCEKFAADGVETIGIDSSLEMLSVARESAEELNILYLNQEMANFELYGTVNLIYSTCDSVNYVLEEDELLKVFRLVNNYLEPQGLFVFDISTKNKYKNLLADKTFVNQVDGAAYIWENYYDEEEQVNEFAVTFFVEEDDGRYRKTEEWHYQRAYEVEQIQAMLETAGLKVLGIFDDYTKEPYTDQTIRATFVAQEIEK